MSGNLKYIFITIFLALFFANKPVFAQENEKTPIEVNKKTERIKDSDLDGISDEEEANYNTNPNGWDTDGDGYFDGFEIIYQSDPLDPSSTPVTDLEKQNIKFLTREDPLAWYIARIAGITSFILFTCVVVMGLVQSSRSLVKIKIMGVQTALEIHQTIAVTAFAFLILHITSLFFDEFFLLKIPELIIPLSIKRDFQSALGYDFALPVSIGVIGFYTAIVLLMTSYLRAKKISMKTWRAIHYLSFLGYLSFILHGFLSGSDSNEFWMRTIYITSLSVVLILVIARIFRKKLFFKKSFPTDKKE